MPFKWDEPNTDEKEIIIEEVESNIDKELNVCASYYGVYNPLCPSPKSEERAKIMARKFDKFIYFDNNATHPVLDSVREKMNEMSKLIGNGSSNHDAGVHVRAFIEESRQVIADFVNISDASKLIFGGCGSEMNNTFIKGVAFKNLESEQNEIITTNVEHKSVLESVKYLEKFGFKSIILPVNSNGLVDDEILINAVNDKTLLVSIMQANNEIGTILPIHRYNDIAKEKNPNVLFHSDMSQSIGKMDGVTVRNIDAATFTAHKFGGPIGVGALYLKDLDVMDSLIHGGNQEFKKRAGTYNQTQIFGMSKAIMGVTDKQLHHMLALRKHVEEEMVSNFSCKINAWDVDRLVNTVSVTFDPIVYGESYGEKLVEHLSKKDIFISTSSACNSREKNPSYVLKAIGLSDAEAYSTIRISFNKNNKKEEIDQFIQEIKNLNLN